MLKSDYYSKNVNLDANQEVKRWMIIKGENELTDLNVWFFFYEI